MSASALLPPSPIPDSGIALLVTTYNVPSRTAMYESRLRWWLANTTLDLFVVDSAGRCFPTLRVRCHAFNYSGAGSPLLRASIGERRSILEALSAHRRRAGRRRDEGDPRPRDPARLPARRGEASAAAARRGERVGLWGRR